MFISLYQAYENPSVSGYTSELHLLFNRTPPVRVRVVRQEGNTLEKALNKIGREDIVKQCIFNVELVTDDVEKAVARVRLDHPGFDSLKEELGPSRDSSLRRDGTLGDRKVKIDYEEPDRMRDSESIEDLRTVGNVPHKQTKQQHITINGTTVFNGTSTPIKDKYASEEKELVDDMADFIEHKCHTTDTMTKRIRDEEDDDNKNRQKIIEDANKLVTDVTEEAERRAQTLAVQAQDLEKSGHDSAEIDGTLERHVTSATTKQPVPDPHQFIKSSSLKKDLCLDLDGNKYHPKSRSSKSKIPQASPKPLASVPLDISLEDSSQKSKIPVKTKELKKKGKNDEAVTKVTTKSKADDVDTMVISNQSIVTEKLEGDSGETVITKTVTSVVSESFGSLSQSDMEQLFESNDLVAANAIGTLETSTRTVVTERIPKSTSKEENSAGTSVKETLRSISTKSSWESSSRSHSKENWDQIQCSLDTSPGSGDIAFTKNSDSRHELASDSDSDGSPRARRRSVSKRRTLGSSSGSDVALHEGAELSPLEDDQAKESSIPSRNSSTKSSSIVTPHGPYRMKSNDSPRNICWLIVTTAVLIGVIALYLALELPVLHVRSSHDSKSGI